MTPLRSNTAPYHSLKTFLLCKIVESFSDEKVIERSKAALPSMMTGTSMAMSGRLVTAPVKRSLTCGCPVSKMRHTMARLLRLGSVLPKGR